MSVRLDCGASSPSLRQTVRPKSGKSSRLVPQIHFLTKQSVPVLTALRHADPSPLRLCVNTPGDRLDADVHAKTRRRKGLRSYRRVFSIVLHAARLHGAKARPLGRAICSTLSTSRCIGVRGERGAGWTILSISPLLTRGLLHVRPDGARSTHFGRRRGCPMPRLYGLDCGELKLLRCSRKDA